MVWILPIIKILDRLKSCLKPVNARILYNWFCYHSPACEGKRGQMRFVLPLILLFLLFLIPASAQEKNSLEKEWPSR